MKPSEFEISRSVKSYYEKLRHESRFRKPFDFFRIHATNNTCFAVNQRGIAHAGPVPSVVKQVLSQTLSAAFRPSQLMRGLGEALQGGRGEGWEQVNFKARWAAFFFFVFYVLC